MTDELRDHVNCLIRHSVLQQIKGVPFTIVANQWAIQGAETAESFYRVSKAEFSYCVSSVTTPWESTVGGFVIRFR